MIAVTDLWRYPIKAIGRERLESIQLVPGKTLPGDRLWAVAHEAARLEPGWNPCRNFARAASGPALQAITTQTGPDGAMTLTHPDLPPLTLTLPADSDALLAWLTPLWPADRPPLSQVVPSGTRGMTDSDNPTVSIMNLASLRALSQKSGLNLQPERFRGNVWIDGAAPWEEHDWTGKTITLGTATLHVDHPITRCMATHANPATGRRDADVLRALNSDWDHQFFGVNAVVETAGSVAIGDTLIP